jgi:type IV pilus assembly protein PilO
MPMGPKERQQLMVLLIILAVGAAGGFWYFLWSPKQVEAAALEKTADSLQGVIRAARQDLRAGTIEQIRHRIADYESGLQVMRELVPAQSEIPTLLDDIASRASLRGVHIGQFSPGATEPGQPFDTQRYQLSVYGHFDQIGEFLADVASLPRIMVPYDVTLGAAQPNNQQAYNDTTGALLEVRFSLRTFVKSQTGGASEGM